MTDHNPEHSSSGTDRAVAEMGALKLSVRIDGEWRRMQALGDRARAISEAGNKSYQEAKESLSGGITPGKNSSSGGQKAADDADDLEW